MPAVTVEPVILAHGARSSLRVTPQQQAILDAVGKTTTVSAGAGAGKTGVMVERFLEILRQSRDGSLPADLRAGVGNILTITFTEDAAIELKHRLVERLNRLGWTDERREVETAYISTIHSFCRRLLKENPFEAGLDPQFRVVPGGENDLLIEQAFEQVVDEGFAAELPEVVGLFLAFSNARRFGANGLDPIHLVRTEASRLCDRLRSKGWRRDDLSAWIGRGPEAVFAANLRAIAGYLCALTGEVRALLDGLDRLPLGVSCALETARLELIGLLSELPDPAGGAGNPETPDIQWWLQQITEIRKRCGKTSTRTGADPRAAGELKDRLRTVATRLDREKKLLAEFDPIFEEESAQQCWWLLQVTSRLWDRHDELKRAAGALDFNDLQSFARDLLEQSESVRSRYRRKLRHVMVDEFQDTDSLQYQILMLLRGERNLFCVGDPKQSIYGFRNADVSLFRRLIELIRGRDPDSAVHLTLSHNFRCRPEIIQFVNKVCGQAGVGAGIDYEPLVSGAAYGDRDEPCVELLLASTNKEQDTGSPPDQSPAPQEVFKAAEAELVAKRIRQMIDQGQLRVTACGDRQGEPFQFRDFTILLRTFTPLGDYERALAKHGVDYYVVGGRGYYARREIRDIANLLQVIRNPLDDVALAATLRSPFCGLSDEALYQLALWGRPFGSLHAGVLHALEHAPLVCPRCGMRIGEAGEHDRMYHSDRDPGPGTSEVESDDFQSDALKHVASERNLPAQVHGSAWGSPSQQSGVHSPPHPHHCGGTTAAEITHEHSGAVPGDRTPGRFAAGYPEPLIASGEWLGGSLALPSDRPLGRSPDLPEGPSPAQQDPHSKRTGTEAGACCSASSSESGQQGGAGEAAVGSGPGADGAVAYGQPREGVAADQIPAEDLARLAPFWGLVERTRRREDRTPVAELLEDLLGETLYEARLLLEPNGRRKMANVRKLVVAASARNSCGVSEFLEWLNQLTRVQEKEGEAPTEEEAANVVRIRTIHNAKGLESNVIILGGIGKSPLGGANKRPAFVFDAETGAGGCQYPSPDTFKSKQSATFSVLWRAAEQKEADEALRLLYVAMTRAREHLILAGELPCKADSWAARLLPPLGITSAPQQDETIEVEPGLSVTVRSKVPGHRLQSAVSKTLMESLQSKMRAGQPLTEADLESLASVR